MFGYVVRRVIAGFLVIVVTSMIVFALFFFGPSNPGLSLCQQTQPRCTPEQAEAYNVELGFRDPVVGQYVAWAKGIFVGREFKFGGSTYDCPAPCLGISYTTRQPVTDEIKRALPVSLSIAVGAAVIFLPLGVLLGVTAARKRGTMLDRIMVSSSLILSSIPYYLVILLSFLYLIATWGVFPEPQYVSFTDNPWSWFTGLLLAWIVFGIYNSTAYARFSRGSMVDALNEDYVRTAQAKGLPQSRVVVKHALRAGIAPVITIFGLDMATLLAGTIFIEYIFGYHGLGALSLESIRNQNFPVIQATSLILAAAVVLANMSVDIFYSVIDPRVRLA